MDLSQYHPNEVDLRWQENWENSKIFSPKLDSLKPAYSIVIPPPNVTGVLHLGHILNNTFQDILARRARQKGFEVLWLPGTDHAGIATQNRVEKFLLEEKGKRREQIGRKAFLEAVWEWKQKHGNVIIGQLKRLGCSCDWSRERFTMDEEYSKWISSIFIKLFEKDFIYRGRRMVNWCPASLTALSDEEVIMKESKSKLYFIRYFLEESSSDYIVVATTRPETLMGDTALAVHPKDERYQNFLKKNVCCPFSERKIPIIVDDRVQKDFGTGALKITPFHDKLDFEIGQDHGLPFLEVINEHGNLCTPEYPEFDGMERFVARKAVVNRLKKEHLLEKVEEYVNNVGYSERANVVVEPRISMQWFLRYPCVEEAKKVLGNEVSFFPKHWEKTYQHWMNRIQDWCIGRQLWWGHQIPVWYLKEKFEKLKSSDSIGREQLERGEVYLGEIPPSNKEDWIQEEDVLDTWFSAWLWPFASMDQETRNKFYPTNALVTGPDILFFWVARMLMAGLYFTKKPPFKEVFFTSLIRDAQGRKMSKSLGNSPDATALIEKYGADGVRFGLVRIAPTGLDIHYDEKKIVEGRNFVTKLVNASRLRLLFENFPSGVPALESEDLKKLDYFQIDILKKLEDLEKRIEKAYLEYDFHALSHYLYTFFWSEYCDKFLEISKSHLHSDSPQKKDAIQIIDFVFWRFLQCAYPFIPHVVEEISHSLGYLREGEFFSEIPLSEKENFLSLDTQRILESQEQASQLYESVQILRDLKARNKLSARKDIVFIVRQTTRALEVVKEELRLLVGVKEIKIESDYKPAFPSVACATPLGEFYLPLADFLDLEKEKHSLEKEAKKIESQIRASQEKLINSHFCEKAPSKVVEKERQRLVEAEEKLKQIQSLIEKLFPE